MNRMAERIVPIMNDAELQTLITSSYENDAQTLTSETESNLLKFRELLEILSEDEAKRWENIKRGYCQNIKMKGIGSDDQAAHVIAQLSGFNDQLEALRTTLIEAAQESRIAGQSTEDQRSEAFTREIGELNKTILQVGDSLQNLAPAPVEPAAESPADRGPSPIDLANDPTTELHRITVQHKVPRSILQVLRNQFELMHQWMEPTFVQTQQQTDELKELRTAIDTCIASYSTLVGELESAPKQKRSSD
jgi:hypothetical protein